MLRNITSGKLLSKQQKRLAVVAQQTARNRGHRQTNRYAVRQLKALEKNHQRSDQRHPSPYSHNTHAKKFFVPPPPPPASAAAGPHDHYERQDVRTGNSVLQQRFDDLVKEALLQYGPPLPAELVADNHIVTGTASPHAATADLGADGRSFEMHDEVPLKMTELFIILKKQKPSFTIHGDCDGVPLALMVKNCSYLRAYGGKVRYMRFFKREKDHNSTPVISVSIGKYKMREYPSQDGVRQGPQPWLYSYGMK